MNVLIKRKKKKNKAVFKKKKKEQYNTENKPFYKRKLRLFFFLNLTICKNPPLFLSASLPSSLVIPFLYFR